MAHELSAVATTVIWRMVSDEDLAHRLVDDMQAHAIQSAQWFRVASLYYPLACGYNSALAIGSLHAEHRLIEKENSALLPLIQNRLLVFFGIGVGDTETAVIDAAIQKQRRVEAVLVDVNPEFLQLFLSSLTNRQKEFPDCDLQCCAIHGLFEQISVAGLDVAGALCRERTFVCLGSTVGNYRDTHEALGLFNNVMRSGDRVVLTYQLDTHLEVIFERYSRSALYDNLIGNFLSPDQRARMSWRLDRNRATVEAWVDDVQLFRSKKFKVAEVTKTAMQYGWHEELCSVDSNKNVCLHVFRK